ncbi:hypothetical protein R1sor_027137 [Riccia sorocarpa]|uniref:Uncharacterized protein n=1 Tax=Riccia sorocarpa TaxID=122646 RepID=A0ABD3GFH8_9MARC
MSIAAEAVWRELVNEEELNEKKPFIVEGDVKREPCYSWMFRDSNFQEVARILKAAKELHGVIGDVPVILVEDETRVKPTVRWEARRDTLMGFCGDKENHYLSFFDYGVCGSDLVIITYQFFSRVGGMRGYERNYDFGDLLDCASGLNRLAALEYGEEAVKISKGHVKQRTLWVKLHPLPPD